MRGLSRVLKISAVESRIERRLILEGKLLAPWVSPDSWIPALGKRFIEAFTIESRRFSERSWSGRPGSNRRCPA